MITGPTSAPILPPATEVVSAEWESEDELPFAAPASTAGWVVKTLKPGSAEFEKKNSRRFELIDKKVDSELTPDEELEFASLQVEILAAAKQYHPLPRFDHDHLLQKLKEAAGNAVDPPN